MKKTNFLAILGLMVALTLSACGGKSDADIQREVQTRVNKPGVTTAVKDGVVTLTGTVTTQEESKAAEAAAKGEGVKSVTNNLQIRPASLPTSQMTNPTTPMANSGMASSATAGMNSNAARR